LLTDWESCWYWWELGAAPSSPFRRLQRGLLAQRAELLPAAAARVNAARKRRPCPGVRRRACKWAGDSASCCPACWDWRNPVRSGPRAAPDKRPALLLSQIFLRRGRIAAVENSQKREFTVLPCLGGNLEPFHLPSCRRLWSCCCLGGLGNLPAILWLVITTQVSWAPSSFLHPGRKQIPQLPSRGAGSRVCCGKRAGSDSVFFGVGKAAAKPSGFSRLRCFCTWGTPRPRVPARCPAVTPNGRRALSRALFPSAVPALCIVRGSLCCR